MTTGVSLERTYTVEEFMRLPDDWYRYELVHGRLQRMPPTGGDHGRIASALTCYLTSYVRAHGLGDTFAAETAFVLDPTTRDVRGPDVAFVARARLAGVGEGAVPVPPDLAIEVVSPTGRLREVRKKVSAYQQAGVALVWVVYPRRHTVDVYHPADTDPAAFGLEDTLDGEDVLPGFMLPVRTVFSRRPAATNG